MMHQRPERVKEHERQRPLLPLSRSLHLHAPGPPPSPLPLYPSSCLSCPPPSFLLLRLDLLPMAAVPPTLPLRSPAALAPFLCPDSPVQFRLPLPPHLAALPLSLTFEWLDDLQFVWEVGPSCGPQVEVPEGHDAF